MATVSTQLDHLRVSCVSSTPLTRTFPVRRVWLDLDEVGEFALPLFRPLLRECISTARAGAVDQNEDVCTTGEKELFEFPIELFEDIRLVGPQLTARYEDSIIADDPLSPFRSPSIATGNNTYFPCSVGLKRIV